MSKSYFANNENDTKNIASELLQTVIENRVLLLNGDMGAGKTTFVRYLVELLNGSGTSSPTFSIVQTYSTNDKKILHADFYRLQSKLELEQIGFYEMLDNCDLAIIEWSEMVSLKDYLEKYTEICIVKQNNEKREFIVNVKNK